MITKIKIQKFRGFKELECYIAPTTVLMGPNSSGKTTVLHAIRVAYEILQLAAKAAERLTIAGSQISLANQGLIENPSTLLPLSDWNAFFLDQKVGQGTSFKVHILFGDGSQIQELLVTVLSANNNQLKYKIDLVADGIIGVLEGLSAGSTKRTERAWEWLSERMPRAIFIPPSYGVVREEELRSRVVVNKLVGAGDQSHVVRNLVVDLDASQFDGLNRFLDELVNTRISRRTSEDGKQNEWPLRVEFQDSNGAIELSSAGAGLVNLIALYASLIRWRLEAKNRDIVFLLDEPEAHLHPKLQANTALALSRLISGEFGSQLLMATHSVDIINAMGNRDATNLIRTDRTKFPACQEISSFSELLTDLSGWVDLEPYTALNFLSSRKILFHEGPSDAKVLEQCARVLFRNRLSELDRFHEWALVSLGGSGNNDVPKLLKKLVKSPAVHRMPVPDFKVITVLDRDYSRQSSSEKIADGQAKAEYEEIVWSRHSIESLFVDEPVLLAWLRALKIESAQVQDVLRQAIVEANASQEMNHAAYKEMVMGIMDTETGRDRQQRFDHADQKALELVQTNPEIWQRGKDRANFVLGKIRDTLEHAQRRQFRTDLPEFIDSIEHTSIINPELAIPKEIRDLLTAMAKK